MIAPYSKRLAQINSSTNKTTSQLTTSQLGVIATAPLTIPPPSSFFSTKASQLRSTSSLSRPQRKTLANTPQRIAQTFSSPSHLPPSRAYQRHLRAADTRLSVPKVSPRLPTSPLPPTSAAFTPNKPNHLLQNVDALPTSDTSYG